MFLAWLGLRSRSLPRWLTRQEACVNRSHFDAMKPTIHAIRPSVVPARVRLVPSLSGARATDALVLLVNPILAGSLPRRFPQPDLQRMLASLAKSGEFKGKPLETAVLHTWGKL